MCVAVVVPAGVKLTEEQLRAMHRVNGDSWGFGFWNHYKGSSRPDGYLTALRGVSDSDDMVKAYFDAFKDEALKRDSKPHLVHFRIRTSGRVNIANAHPFNIKDGLLIHNGVLAGGGDADYSDTYYFARVFNDHLPATLTKEQKERLGKIVGTYNKLCVLHRTGEVSIINEDQGHRYENGVWASNTYWQRY